MTEFRHFETLRDHRPLLLACEAIGWLHMTGKAKIDFLRDPEKNAGEQWYQSFRDFFNQFFAWLDPHLQKAYSNWLIPGSPPTLKDLLKSMFEDYAKKQSQQNLVGLLQAGHAMASGIEKNLPKATSQYLCQDVTHMWLSTAFGHPVRNLLADPPELLTAVGWKRLLEQIEQLLTVLKELGGSPNDIDGWWGWRDGAVASTGWLRQAFTSTLAETRLPNNDVTLFDQSYVASALFKSAVAGAILEGDKFSWSNTNLKQQTRWRLLTIGIGADHYEARAIKIGDWTGARLALDDFFARVRKLVEVDLAVGSLLYRDGESCVFSFPGERFDKGEQKYKGGDLRIADWQRWLTEQIDGYARDANLEMPPYCSISEPSRSLVGMTVEIRRARETMAVPLHSDWRIPGQDSAAGHVCPVCLVRRSSSGKDKQMPCDPCKGRRTGRLNSWLGDRENSDTIWISEVADANDRVALVTMSLDIEPWLDGTRLDALRTQAIPEWRKFNHTLKGQANPIDPSTCYGSLLQYIKGKLQTFSQEDIVLGSLQDGYQCESEWASFFSKIVEDRVGGAENRNHQGALNWNNLRDDDRAAWLTHQLFRKFASPGRIYRFERQAEDFFKALLAECREIAAADQDRWRVRRLVIKPDNGSSGSWEDGQVYNGRYGDAPVSLLYREDTNDFLTICNLARLLKPEQDKNWLHGITLELKTDDSVDTRQLVVRSTKDCTGALGVYHPVIPLELSPVRFRVLLPLEAASDCVDRATRAWSEQFARVWDRLPLRIGVVAFPRMTPFQAVVEAARNMESDLDGMDTPETWQVTGCETRGDVTTLGLRAQGYPHELLQTMPIRLPDGRDDMFYPYLAVKDQQVRSSLDFQHPDRQVFRHVKELRSGDEVLVYPSLTATLFMDGTARRFEPLCRRNLAEWRQMRDLWRMIDRVAPSQSALRGAWSEIVERREDWQGPDGTWLAGGKTAWLDFARAVFHERLGARGACLETLVAAVGDGLLDWSLEWHMRVLKKQVSGGK